MSRRHRRDFWTTRLLMSIDRLSLGFSFGNEDGFPHLLPGLELDHGARRDGYVGFRRVGIPSDTRLAQLHFEHSEVSEFNSLAFGNGFTDVIEGLLDYIKHLLLNEACLIADADYEVSFGDVFGHISFVF